VLAGYPRKGLIWHFQGSGKSLLMVFAAQKLRLHPA
jgi:type I restriction enzyme R subunit